ncbi:MAG: glycosyltransferase family 2 protein [Alphaproteobacteria bacterium]|nr:glycosyltransferase family 2 protein [Alphaproteobacteria bacterium]
MKKISVVIPCYNEEENIENTYNLVKSELEKQTNYDYEIIFSDNDSKDSSQKLIKKICEKDKKVKAIFNLRNFGPNCSCFNAMLNATGDAVILLFCDLQTPVEMLSKFIKEWENGNLVVFGRKISSEENKMMYFIRTFFYKIINFFSDLPHYEHVTGSGLYDKSVLVESKNLKEPVPDLRHMVPYMGYKPYLIPYEQKKRQFGKSSYTLSRYLDQAIRLFIQTSTVPMKFMIYLGILSSVVSFFVGMFYFVYKLIHWSDFSVGMAPMIILFTFISSIQIFFLGIIGEYILNITNHVNFSKLVIEKERINFDNS